MSSIPFERSFGEQRAVDELFTAYMEWREWRSPGALRRGATMIMISEKRGGEGGLSEVTI